MLKRAFAALSLVCFCCLMSACTSPPDKPVEQKVDEATRPGAAEGSGPSTSVVE